MFLNSKTVWTRVVFIFLATGMLGLSLISLGFAASLPKRNLRFRTGTILRKCKRLCATKATTRAGRWHLGPPNPGSHSPVSAV